MFESQKTSRLGGAGAETLDRLATAWDRYGRYVLGVIGAIAALGLLAFLTMRARSASETQAAARLAEADITFWQGDYARSLEMARQVGAQYPSAPSGLEAHRLAGDAAYWIGDFKTAVAEYRRYLDKEKRKLLADAARRSLAYALESDGQVVEAARLYDSLVGVFDRSSSAEFLAAAARCYRLAGQRDEAIRHLKRIDQEFGETSYASQARIELGELSATAH
jgi:tetratricopeptide (TPR) repeat protein